MVALATNVPDADEACRRDYRRALLSLPSAIMLPKGEFPCSLEDISLGGARIRAEHKIACGDAVWLRLEKLKVFGTVKWARDDQYGIEFEEHLPKTLVMRLQGHAVDPEEYKAIQAMLMARNWAIGNGPATRTRSMRLRDVIGREKHYDLPDPEPETEVEIAEPVADLEDDDQSWLIRDLRKQSREKEGNRRIWTVLLLALAALAGALLGVGSLLFG